MKKYFLTISIFCAVQFSAKSQTAIDSIKAVINTTFLAMKTSDTILLKTAFADNAILQTTGRNKEGDMAIVTLSVGDFAKAVSTFPAGAIDEQIQYETIKIDRNIAAVWAPYKLYIKGNFHQCGVNSLQLIRLDGLWKILHILDTRSKIGCE